MSILPTASLALLGWGPGVSIFKDDFTRSWVSSQCHRGLKLGQFKKDRKYISCPALFRSLGFHRRDPEGIPFTFMLSCLPLGQLQLCCFGSYPNGGQLKQAGGSMGCKPHQEGGGKMFERLWQTQWDHNQPPSSPPSLVPGNQDWSHPWYQTAASFTNNLQHVSRASETKGPRKRKCFTARGQDSRRDGAGTCVTASEPVL